MLYSARRVPAQVWRDGSAAACRAPLHSLRLEVVKWRRLCNHDLGDSLGTGDQAQAGSSMEWSTELAAMEVT